ncbi:MAG: sugar-binding domain-containing protein, partial [Promethearchaeota archaeon]
MVNQIKLNGFWRFCRDDFDEGIDQQWYLQENQAFLEEKIQKFIPSCWPIEKSTGSEEQSSIFWLWRMFRVRKYADKSYVLHFESIMHKVIIYIDGAEIGRFNGAFLPFELDVTKFVDGNKHFLAIRIDASPGSNRYFDHENYGKYGGILGDILIKTKDPVVLEERTLQTKFQTDVSFKVKFIELTFNFYFINTSDFDYSGNLHISISRDFMPIAETDRQLNILKKNSRLSKIVVIVPKENLKIWTPETPNLYSLHITLGNKTGVIIEDFEEIGIKTVEFKDVNSNPKLILNGKEFLVKGADFDVEDPEFGYWNPLPRIFRRMKELKDSGVNLIKPVRGIFTADMIKYASRLGLLILENLPITELNPIEIQHFYNEWIQKISFLPALLAYNIPKEIDQKEPVIAHA